MLAVLYIIAWSVLGKIEYLYREGRLHERGEAGEIQSQDLLHRKLPLWKALSLGLVTAGLIVYFIVRP